MSILDILILFWLVDSLQLELYQATVFGYRAASEPIVTMSLTVVVSDLALHHLLVTLDTPGGGLATGRVVPDVRDQAEFSHTGSSTLAGEVV